MKVFLNKGEDGYYRIEFGVETSIELLVKIKNIIEIDYNLLDIYDDFDSKYYRYSNNTELKFVLCDDSLFGISIYCQCDISMQSECNDLITILYNNLKQQLD